MNFDKVKELIEIISKSPYTEFTYKEGDFELSLKKDEKVNLVSEVKEINKVEEKYTEENSDDAEYIKSPLVGSFYTAAAPGEKPFVSVGDKVSKGQVIGIVEAMKLMNEIESPYDGVIEAILIDNEQMVEYDEPLFKISTNK